MASPWSNFATSPSKSSSSCSSLPELRTLLSTPPTANLNLAGGEWASGFPIAASTPHFDYFNKFDRTICEYSNQNRTNPNPEMMFDDQQRKLSHAESSQSPTSSYDENQVSSSTGDSDLMKIRRLSGESERDFQQRKSASDRERSRMRDMNRAFDMLREKLADRKLPGKRLSKIQTLRFAIQYIAELEDVLQIAPPSPDPDFYQSVSYNPAMLMNPHPQFPVVNQIQASEKLMNTGNLHHGVVGAAYQQDPVHSMACHDPYEPNYFL